MQIRFICWCRTYFVVTFRLPLKYIFFVQIQNGIPLFNQKFAVRTFWKWIHDKTACSLSLRWKFSVFHFSCGYCPISVSLVWYRYLYSMLLMKKSRRESFFPPKIVEQRCEWLRCISLWFWPAVIICHKSIGQRQNKKTTELPFFLSSHCLIHIPILNRCTSHNHSIESPLQKLHSIGKCKRCEFLACDISMNLFEIPLAT